MSDALESWLEHLGELAVEVPRVVEETTVHVTLDPSKVPDGTTFNVGDAPDNFRLIMDGDFRAVTEFEFTEHSPREVELHVPASVDTLGMRSPDGHSIPSLQLNVESRDEALDVRTPATELLTVKGGQFNLGPMRRPHHLSLEDTTIGAGWDVDELTLSGRVSLNGNLQSRRTLLREEVSLGGGDWRLGELLGVDGSPPRLRVVGANVSMKGAPAASQLRCDGGILRLDEEGRIRSPVLVGPGQFHVYGWLTAPRFVSEDQPVNVYVYGRVLDGEGEIVLHADRRAIVSGAEDGALVLKRVQEATEAEIENVDVYRIDVDSVDKLSSAERFYPWLPSVAWKCRQREKAMFGDEKAGLARRHRTHFWSRMSTILKETHAPGRIQSEVRYAAQLARQRSSPSRRERVLLRAYWLLGYGERIVRPLIWYAVLSFGLTIWFAGPFMRRRATLDAALEIWRLVRPMWGRVAQAPLAFFRLTESVWTNLDSPAQQAAVLSFRVIGLLLIVLSLLAVRRLVRLE